MTKAFNITKSYVGKKMTNNEYAGIISGSDRLENRDQNNWGHLVYTEKSFDDLLKDQLAGEGDVTRVYTESVRKEVMGSLGPHLGAVMRRYNNGSARYDRRFSEYEHIPEDTLKAYRASYYKRLELAGATGNEEEFRAWARRRFNEEPHLDQYNELIQLAKSMVTRKVGDCDSHILYADSPSSSAYSSHSNDTIFVPTRGRILMGLPILPIPFRLVEFVLRLAVNKRLYVNTTIIRHRTSKNDPLINAYTQDFIKRLIGDMYEAFLKARRNQT